MISKREREEVFGGPLAGKLKVGDRIKFKAVCRWPTRPVWRTVVGFSAAGLPLVNYSDWDEFIVKHKEIIEVCHG